MNECGTCRYWGGDNEMPQELRSKSYRRCIRIPTPVRTFEQIAVVYVDDEHGFGAFYTKRDFGCTLYRKTT